MSGVGSVFERLEREYEEYLRQHGISGGEFFRNDYYARKLEGVIVDALEKVMSGKEDAEKLWGLVAEYVKIQFTRLTLWLEAREVKFRFNVADISVGKTGVSFTVDVEAEIGKRKLAQRITGVIDMDSLESVLSSRYIDKNLDKLLQHTSIPKIKLGEERTIYYSYGTSNGLVLAGFYLGRDGIWYSLGIDTENTFIHSTDGSIRELLEKLGFVRYVDGHYCFDTSKVKTKKASTVRKYGHEFYVGLGLGITTYAYMVVIDNEVIAVFEGSEEIAREKVAVDLISDLYTAMFGGNADIEKTATALEVYLKHTGLYRLPEYAKYYKIARLINKLGLYRKSDTIPMLMNYWRDEGVMTKELVENIYGKALETVGKTLEAVSGDAKKQVELNKLEPPRKVCKELTGRNKCYLYLKIGDNYYDYEQIYKIIKTAGMPDNIYLVTPRFFKGKEKVLGLEYGGLVVLVTPGML